MSSFSASESASFSSSMADESTFSSTSTAAESSSTGAGDFDFEESGQPLPSSVSIVTPVVYISVLLITFVVFSVIYRRRKLAKLQSMRPLFDENYPEEMYEELKESDDPKVNEKVLKAALLRRGSEAIRRMFKLKESEPYIKALYMKGYIGDDDNERFKITSKLQELEMTQLAREAESYKKGWAQSFFPACQETMLNEALRRRMNAMSNRKAVFSKQWTESTNIRADPDAASGSDAKNKKSS